MTVPNEDGPRRLLDGVTLRLEQLELPGGDSVGHQVILKPRRCSLSACKAPGARAAQPPPPPPPPLPPTRLPPQHQPQYATPRGYGWLGEHQDEAAELVALLHEAAPKLALANLRAPPSAAQRGTAAGLPRARSYDISETTRDRLRAAVPLPTGAPALWVLAHSAASRQARAPALPAAARTPAPLHPPPSSLLCPAPAAAGPGQVDWSALSAVISSELLSYEEHLSPRPSAQPQPPAQPAQHALAAAQVEAALAAEEAALAAAVGSPRSPGGHRLDINSGGWRGCLFGLLLGHFELLQRWSRPAATLLR